MTDGVVTPELDVRVLICDDYAPMRALLRLIIEDHPGLSVAGEASGGDEAITEAARLQPDVVLLDLAMPRKTGLAALGEIRLVAPAAKVVIFSGFSMASMGADPTALGAVGYLQKGASPEAITESIEHAAAASPVTPFAGIPGAPNVD
jgi:DNA-binding NarL/FixJ family response regulator